MTNAVYVERFVKFTHYNGQWQAWVTDYLPSPDTLSSGEKVYRINIRVPEEIAGRMLDHDVVPEPVETPEP